MTQTRKFPTGIQPTVELPTLRSLHLMTYDVAVSTMRRYIAELNRRGYGNGSWHGFSHYDNKLSRAEIRLKEVELSHPTRRSGITCNCGNVIESTSAAKCNSCIRKSIAALADKTKHIPIGQITNRDYEPCWRQ
jgi:hypothetical protein